MRVERIRPAENPACLDLEDTKRWARVDAEDEDRDFARMIDAVALEAEEYAQIALFEQTVRVLLPNWPQDHLRLPIGPILDPASLTVTIDSQPWTDLRLDAGTRPLLALHGHPPAGGAVIEYRAGFGSRMGDIPADIRQAMTDQVAVYYDARGAVDVKAATFSPQFIRILGRYRGVRL